MMRVLQQKLEAIEDDSVKEVIYTIKGLWSWHCKGGVGRELLTAESYWGQRATSGGGLASWGKRSKLLAHDFVQAGPLV